MRAPMHVPVRAAGMALAAAAWCAQGSAQPVQAQAPAQRPAAESPFQLPPLQPAAGPAMPEGFVPQGFVFEGPALVPMAELDDIAAPFVGQPLDTADLETLRQRLTRQLIARGFINSGVLVGEPAVREGRVVLRVVAGRVREVRQQGLEGLHDGYLSERLVRPGDTALNVEVLRERFQLQLEDPLFERLNARLLPGEAPGDAILDIDVARARPYQLTAYASNHRPPSTGANGYGLSGWVRNLTGRGDYLEAGLSAPVHATGGVRGSLGWRMPLNTRGTQFIAQFDRGQSSVVEEPLRVLDIESRIDSRELGVSQALIEETGQKLSVGVSRMRRENRTTLLGEPFSFAAGERDGVTRIWSWRFWQEYTLRSDRQVLALRSTFQRARNNLLRADELPVPVDVPAQRYGLWLGQAQYVRQVQEQGAQLAARLNVQHSGQRLAALDQIAIGGASTVRGYRENTLVRDTGVIFNIELDVPVVRRFGDGLNMSLVPFYDIGRGKNRGAAADTISSAGLATHLRWQRLSAELAYGKRLAHPAALDAQRGTLQDRGWHLRVAYEFFGH